MIIRWVIWGLTTLMLTHLGTSAHEAGKWRTFGHLDKPGCHWNTAPWDSNPAGEWDYYYKVRPDLVSVYCFAPGVLIP